MTSVPIASGKKGYVPELTSSEKQLLSDNEGCFKCQAFYVSHRSSNCPAGFPDPAKDPIQSLNSFGMGTFPMQNTCL